MNKIDAWGHKIHSTIYVGWIFIIDNEFGRRKRGENMTYKNSEGYSDPTAGKAVVNAKKEEQDIDSLNHKVIQSFRLLVDLAGFEIVGRVTLRHKKSGRIFK